MRLELPRGERLGLMFLALHLSLGFIASPALPPLNCLS